MSSLEVLFGPDARILHQREFQLMMLANVMPATGTAMLSPILDSLIGPFGASEATIGLMMSFFTAPPILLIPIFGGIADQHGRKVVLVPSLILFGVAGAAIAFTTSFPVALGLRFLQGVGFAGSLPVIITILADMYSDSREATAQGFRFTTTGIGQAVFPLLAGLLVGVAWQFPFFLNAVAIPVALLIYVWYEEPPLDSKARDGDDDDDDTSYRRAIYGVVRQRHVLALVVGRALGVVVWIAFLTYNSIIVVRILGGTPAEAGILTAVAAIAAAATASQAGRIAAAFDSQLSPLVIANGLLGIGFVAVLFAPSVPVAMVAIGMASAGFGVLLSLYRPVITGLAPRTLRGGVVSLSEAGGRLSATLTPLAMGGVIALATPSVAFAPAVQLGGVGIAVVGAGGGILSLGLAILWADTDEFT